MVSSYVFLTISKIAKVIHLFTYFYWDFWVVNSLALWEHLVFHHSEPKTSELFQLTLSVIEIWPFSKQKKNKDLKLLSSYFCCYFSLVTFLLIHLLAAHINSLSRSQYSKYLWGYQLKYLTPLSLSLGWTNSTPNRLILSTVPRLLTEALPGVQIQM